jgi:hypothetical protein
MSFFIREAEDSSENPHRFTLEGFEPDRQKAFQFPTLAEATEVRDGFYHEEFQALASV